jgi:hypothetical protein
MRRFFLRRANCMPRGAVFVLMALTPFLLAAPDARARSEPPTQESRVGFDGGGLSRVIPVARAVWRGGAGDARWSNLGNWDGNRVPGARDVAHFDADSSGEAMVDPAFAGQVAGIVLEEGYVGTVRLARPLVVRGDLSIAGGVFEQSLHPLVTVGWSQAAGEFVGGDAPVVIQEGASVRGGVLTTPRAAMNVRALEIQAPGLVRMGANGKLNLTGDGTPLTGDGVLDVTTNAPNSVEYTGRATSDITSAGPAVTFHQLGANPRQDLASRANAPTTSRGFSETGVLTHSEGNIYTSVIDSGAGYAYFGTSSSSPVIIKVRLSDFTRVGTLTLDAGGGGLHSAVIDMANGFAYFGTGSQPGEVVKVQLSDFTHVATLTLNPSEGCLRSAVIDSDTGNAYFGTACENSASRPAKVIKVKLSDFTRVGALTLYAGEDDLRSAVIDTTSGFAYFGTYTSPGKVVKVRLSDFTRVGAVTLNTGEYYLGSAVIDPANGFAYFGTAPFALPSMNPPPGKVIKIRLSDFTRVDALTFVKPETTLQSAVIDTVNGFAYFGAYLPYPAGIIVKVRLSDFTRVGALTLSDGECWLISAAIDPGAGFAYFGTETSPGRIIKVQLSDFTRVGALTLTPGENNLQSAVIDLDAGFAYFGTGSNIIVKVRLSDFTRTGALTLNSDERELQCAVIDPAAGFVYFGTYTTPGKVVKVKLADFTRVDALTLNTGENLLRSALIDPANGFAYFGASTHIIVKVRLSDFTRDSALTLNGDEAPSPAVIDTGAGFAYWGTATQQGKIVKVQLSDLTRVGALTLNAGENWLQSAVIDPGAGFAYFGTYTDPGKIVKVRLPDFTRVGALTLNAGEGFLKPALIDPANGFAYFGAGGDPGVVVKVRLSDFTRVSVLTLNAGEKELSSAVIDPRAGIAYLGTGTYPGIVVRIALGNTMTRITSNNSGLSEVGQAVTVNYAVASTVSGNGTPEGNVTVLDSASGASCTGTVATGKCDITFYTPGVRTLTATYGGDSDFNNSKGTASHQVNGVVKTFFPFVAR